MHNDPEMFKNLMGEIDAIEINRQLDNDGLKRAVCNVFLSHGPRLLLVTSKDNKAWLYFKNDKLIAAHTKDKSNLDALEELIEWTDVHVNEYRNVDCNEQHFKLDVQYFQVFCQKDELGDHDYYNALYKIRQLRYITGFMIFKKLELYLDELPESEYYPINDMLALLSLELADNGMLTHYDLEFKADFFLLKQKEFQFIFKVDSNEQFTEREQKELMGFVDEFGR